MFCDIVKDLNHYDLVVVIDTILISFLVFMDWNSWWHILINICSKQFDAAINYYMIFYCSVKTNRKHALLHHAATVTAWMVERLCMILSSSKGCHTKPGSTPEITHQVFHLINFGFLLISKGLNVIKNIDDRVI